MPDVDDSCKADARSIQPHTRARGCGGVTPYAYAWRTSTDGYNYGPVLSTSSSLTTDLYPWDPYLYIRLNASSLDQQSIVRYLTVENMGGSPYCQGLAELPEDVTIASEAALDAETPHPNPFNPSTTIGFTIPEHMYVSLAVYDGLGRQVVNLVSGNLESGRHEVRVEAGHLPSGQYWYRLQAGEKVVTRGLVLLK